MIGRLTIGNGHSSKGILIYFLGFYVLLQFVWWAYMLVDLNKQIYDLNLDIISLTEIPGPEQQALLAEHDQQLTLKIWMVLGEGAVFVILLLSGFWAVRRSIAKELRLSEEQKNFLLSITHELKSPLAAIKLQIQTLNSRDLAEEQRKMLYGRALKDADRLQKLVENLLMVNKIESGRLPIEKSTVNMSDMLNELIKYTYADLFAQNSIRLEADDGVLVHADAVALQSIITNLIDNAIKYAPESLITVSLHEDGKAVLCIADNGPGIPDTDKQRVFRRFFRLGSEDTRKTKGTGIGLYMVRALVTMHKGTITVTDNHPTGTRFTVNLPQIED